MFWATPSLWLIRKWIPEAGVIQARLTKNLHPARSRSKRWVGPPIRLTEDAVQGNGEKGILNYQAAMCETQAAIRGPSCASTSGREGPREAGLEKSGQMCREPYRRHERGESAHKRRDRGGEREWMGPRRQRERKRQESNKKPKEGRQQEPGQCQRCLSSHGLTLPFLLLSQKTSLQSNSSLPTLWAGFNPFSISCEQNKT